MTEMWSLIFNTSAVTAGAAAIVFIISKYLNRSSSEGETKEFKRLHSEIAQLRNALLHTPYAETEALEELAAEVEELRAAQAVPSEDERRALVGEIKERLVNEASEEFIRSIEASVAKSKQDEAVLESNARAFEFTLDRLREELFSLSKRGNLNLAIGITTTLAGLGILGVMVMSPDFAAHDPKEFAMAFIPRLALVVLIEVFAYFFLKLYKSSLAEIKYFQNEITTMEAKYLALNVAIHSKDRESVLHAIKTLSGTERNHILEKGQSTVDIEKAKLDTTFNSDVMDKLSRLLKKGE